MPALSKKGKSRHVWHNVETLVHVFSHALPPPGLSVTGDYDTGTQTVPDLAINGNLSKPTTDNGPGA